MTTISPRTPEGVFNFWLGQMRSVGDASRDNWRDRMLMWRLGPFARSAEDREFFDAQRDWCEEIHKEGIDGFFSDPEWETPKGLLAKLIVLDQFPRSVYRGTPAAYANDPVTVRLAEHLCTTGWDMTEYNIMERMWVYVPLSHAEELALQELCVEKYVQWSRVLVAAVPSGRRRLNQFISWSFIKASIEHSDALLIFGRFPHRNAILGRGHKAGEPRYLSDPVRPLWTFTQPPRPDYFAVLGALCRFEDGLDENSIRPEPLAELHKAANLPLDGPDSLMDVFELGGDGAVAYTTLYRHMLLREKERAFEAVCRAPVVEDLFQQIKALILKDPDEPWPPKSAKYSVTPVIDVDAIHAVVTHTPPPVVEVEKTVEFAVADPNKAVSLVLKNDSAELERLTRETEGFAERHGFAGKALFEIQLALEEWVMNTINYGYNDAAEHEIRVYLQLEDDTRNLVVHIVDDGREFDPLAESLEPDFEAFLADRVEGGGVGVQLVLKFADGVKYRRQDGLNHLILNKGV
ncbi:MAG: DUF924 family protein [Deltaproteobacteria bacterium]|nr:DUF924 family protein [Deltaproteobacteria bacterium]